MKIDTKKLNISKKQLVAIAAIAVTGVVLGTAILSNKETKTAEDDGHGHGSHVEAKTHSDGEHHGKKDGDGHRTAGEDSVIEVDVGNGDKVATVERCKVVVVDATVGEYRLAYVADAD